MEQEMARMFHCRSDSGEDDNEVLLVAVLIDCCFGFLVFFLAAMVVDVSEGVAFKRVIFKVTDRNENVRGAVGQMRYCSVAYYSNAVAYYSMLRVVDNLASSTQIKHLLLAPRVLLLFYHRLTA